MRSLLLLTVVTGLLVSACASRGGSDRAGGSDSDGIQTRAYNQAPATRVSGVGSRPLSETNTPDAVAARQAQAEANGHRGEPAAPHEQVAGFQKGSKATVRPGAALRSRPSASSDAIQSLVLNSQVTLDSRVYNADGYWWFASTGADDGWIAQGDLLLP